MAFDILPSSRTGEVIIDAGYLTSKRDIIHGFLESDITNGVAPGYDQSFC